MKKMKRLVAWTLSMIMLLAPCGVYAEEAQTETEIETLQATEETEALDAIAEDEVLDTVEESEAIEETESDYVYVMGTDAVDVDTIDEREEISLFDKGVSIGGSCGASLTWVLRNDPASGAVLVISGTGAMTDYKATYDASAKYSYLSTAPWGKYYEDIIDIIIKPGCTSIGNYAFCYLTSLDYVAFANTIENIGVAAFMYATSLHDITLPTNLKNIGVTAFKNCTFLGGVSGTIIIPKKTVTIGAEAFYNCTNVHTMYIPKSVTTIEEALVNNAIIYGYKGSKAIEYAKKYGFKYHYMDQPQPVKNLTAASYGKYQVKLTWESGDDLAPIGYLIYVKRGSKGTYSYLAATSSTTYVDTHALATDANYYWVFPYNTNEEDERVLGTCTAFKNARGICTAVTNLKAASVTGGVTLTWDATKDAEGYLIYGIHPGESYKYISMTTVGTKYTDKKASKTNWNFYWVYPYFKDSEGKMVVGGAPKYVFGKAK